MAPLFFCATIRHGKGGYIMQIVLVGIGILVIAVLVYLGRVLMKEE